MKGFRNLSESINVLKTLKEAQNLDWFKTTGLQMAKSICQGNNQNCKEVSTTVCTAAIKNGIDCDAESAYVINGEDRNNNHFAIKTDNILIDYTISQFLGDNSTVDYFELADNGNNVYVLNKETMAGEIVEEIKGKTTEEILNLPIDVLNKYIIEII